ncbi:response regulator [Variovorax sp. HJSM1_2]|uniref:response regulator n=1 Tax=Variovorax sp. HJSM1_2 TaxID=3366263 RepID=UPI003BD41166
MRFYLGLLVLVALLPVVFTAGLSIWRLGVGYQTSAIDHLQQTASAVASAVESELSTAFTTLDALASMPLEHAGDHPLADRRGSQTGTFLRGRLSIEGPADPKSPADTLLPSGVPASLVKKVAEHGEPAVSKLFADPKDGNLRVAVGVLYRADKKPDAALVLVLSPAQLLRSLQRQSSYRSDLLVTVVDGDGRTLARSREADRFLGQAVSYWPRVQVSGQARGWFEAESVEGQPVMLTYLRLAGTPGWTVLVGEPLDAFNARWRDPLRKLLLWGGLSAAIALLGALWLARMLFRPVQALAANAGRLGANQGLAMQLVPRTAVREFEALCTGLAEADAALRNCAANEQRSAVEQTASESRCKQLTEALSIEKDRLELVTMAGGVGIMEFDVASQRFRWDKQSHLIFDRTPAEFDGSLEGLLAYLHPDDSARVRERWLHAVAEGVVLDLEMRILQVMGAQRHVRVYAQVHRDADGHADRVMGTVWDVTSERESAEALRRAKDAAEAAERLKSEFLAFMSHEIRTPMNTVLGITRLVMQTQMSAKQRDYLSKIDISAKLLLAIVNDLLDLSKIEAGKMNLEQIEFSLEALLETVSSATGMRAEEKALEVVFSVQPDVPKRLLGDPLRLGQVLINLVGNALKFTEKGEVEVVVARESVVDGRMRSLRFSVRDTGIGLDEQQLLRLFSPFSQGDSHTTRHFGGTGLGLSICRKLVELMQGRIWVNSKPGRGSTFSFIVPVGHIEHSAETAYKPLAQPALGQCRALVVDDNQSAREVLSVMLRGFGLAVDAVSSGRACLERLQGMRPDEARYDLLLMDWRMPEMDGLETARQVYEKYGRAAAPSVLMVTAFAGEDIINRASAMQLAGVLIKPVTPSVLYDTVCDVLGLNSHVPKLSANPGFDLEKLRNRRVLLVDDNALSQEVTTAFLQQVGMQVVLANSGAEAIQCMERGDIEIVLMDSRMPGMDGATATRKLRADPRFTWVPILGLSGETGSDAQQHLRASGMNELLLKPVEATRLYEALAQWLPLQAAFAALVGKRVLVVDDNQLNREVVSEFLTSARMVVETAADGIEAIACLEVADFDAVLMDIQMPLMDGLAATREIRRNRRWARLPVIALTAQDQVVSGLATTAAGMDAYLTKPIDEMQLFRTLLRFMPPAGALAATSVFAGPSAAPLADGQAADHSKLSRHGAVLPKHLPGMDLSLALERLGHQPERVQRLLRGFVRDFSGVDAQLELDMAQARYTQAGEVAHTVKSAARYLGAEDLGEAAQTLERLALQGDAAQLRPVVAAFRRELALVLAGIVQYCNETQRKFDPASLRSADQALSRDTLQHVAALLERIAPQVVQGNYAVSALLAEVKSALAGSSLMDLAEMALLQFEDLELEQAAQAVNALRVKVQALSERT